MSNPIKDGKLQFCGGNRRPIRIWAMDREALINSRRLKFPRVINDRTGKDFIA